MSAAEMPMLATRAHRRADRLVLVAGASLLLVPAGAAALVVAALAQLLSRWVGGDDAWFHAAGYAIGALTVPPGAALAAALVDYRRVVAPGVRIVALFGAVAAAACSAAMGIALALPASADGVAGIVFAAAAAALMAVAMGALAVVARGLTGARSGRNASWLAGLASAASALAAAVGMVLGIAAPTAAFLVFVGLCGVLGVLLCAACTQLRCRDPA